MILTIDKIFDFNGYARVGLAFPENITMVRLLVSRKGIFSGSELHNFRVDSDIKKNPKGGKEMLKEFKEFIMRGNVVDMAVGIIIGAAFGTIISSLVADVIMPPIGLLLGNVDFTNLFVVLKAAAKAPPPYETLVAAKAAGATSINYGVFINTIITFLIVAFAVFLLIRNINKLKREQEAPAPVPTTKECIYCLSTIPIKATRCPHCTSELKGA